MGKIKENIFILMYGILIMIMIGFSLFAFYSFDKRNELSAKIMSDVVAVAKEQYDTEDIILLTELYEEENYSKYELLVEDNIKQAIYIKGTSEIVMIE